MSMRQSRNHVVAPNGETRDHTGTENTRASADDRAVNQSVEPFLCSLCLCGDDVLIIGACDRR